MKVAYISHHKRPCYEYDWFSRLNFEKVKFIDTDFSSYPPEPPLHVEYCKVSYKENKFTSNIFRSTSRLVKYYDFEKYLENVDVVIVLEVFSSLSKQFIQYCKEKNKKVMVLVYELIEKNPLYFLPTHSKNKDFTIQNADSFISISNKAKEHLIKLGASADKIETVYPGIDLERFKPDHSSRKLDRIIFVGNLNSNKGIDHALSLYQKLVDKNSQQEMWVIGDGSYRKQVLDFEKKYKNFKYFGKIENSRLPEYLNSCGVYVLFSRDTYRLWWKIGAEQFGFSLVEAMACGLNIVSTNCGAIPEIITENNIICNQNSFDEMYEKTSTLLENIKDTASADRNIMIAEEKYDIEKQSRKLETALRNILIPYD